MRMNLTCMFLMMGGGTRLATLLTTESLCCTCLELKIKMSQLLISLALRLKRGKLLAWVRPNETKQAARSVVFIVLIFEISHPAK